MKNIEISIIGMDCAECASHVQHAINGVEGVKKANVLLNAEKARIEYESAPPDLSEIRRAVRAAGYDIALAEEAAVPKRKNFGAVIIAVFLVIFLVVIIGEFLGWFDWLTGVIPWYGWLILVLLGGYPVFRNVLRASLQRQIISHSLMTLGVIAAALIGEWTTALIVVFFMRVGEFVESYTTDQARNAVRDLYKLAPQSAFMEKNGEIKKIPIESVLPGDIVIVRPGEAIPVDGIVTSGSAGVDQSAITGESMPASVDVGVPVFSASIVQNGMLKIRTSAVGVDTRFGKVIRMVEEAELNRGEVQRLADRFAGIYLPIVAGIAILTFLVRRDVMAAAAVLVVACSCSFSLATPIAMLASIGAAAKKGLLIKGGKYIERLAAADTVFVDKTGTLTLGEPAVTDVISFGKLDQSELLSFAASVEKYASHPLANAVLKAAKEKRILPQEIIGFEDITGSGIQGEVNGENIQIRREGFTLDQKSQRQTEKLKNDGKTLFFILVNGKTEGVIAAEDQLRPEVTEAIKELQSMGIGRIVLLSGDHAEAVRHVAEKLGIEYQAEMMPEEKIEVVRRVQGEGHVVVMVGDGINDAPALAQADVGIAMGVKGSDIAIEAAHITLLRDDWSLVPLAFHTAKRTMRVVRSNILFTALYNLFGLGLAAFGILPPVFAAALQSLPDIGILANSARLIRSK